MSIILTTYKRVDGIPTLPDSFIEDFYKHLAFKSEMFYNVDPEKFDGFRFFKSGYPRLHVFSEDKIVLGGIWVTLYNSLNKTGFFNYGFMESVHGKKRKLQLAKEGIRLLFDLESDDGSPMYGTLLSETSKSNEKTLQMASLLGFRLIGKIPNGHYHFAKQAFEEVYMMYISKDTIGGK